MSQIFSYNFDNNINLRSNSLITNELHVKDPITGDYKRVVPGQGGGGEAEVDVPYYALDDEINFGSNRTQINGSAAIVPGSVTLKDPSFEVSKNIRINTDNITMDNLDDVVSLNATGILATKSGVPADPILWSDIQEKRDYLEDTEIVFQPVNNVYSRIKNNSVKIGTGSNTNSATNNLSLAYEGLYITGTSGNTTVYRNGEIRRVLSSVTKTLNIGNIADSQTNYLKPDKIEFADGSGVSEGFLHYVDDDSILKSKSIKAIANSGGAPANLPDYIEPYSLDFSNIDPDFATKISGMEITAHVSTLKNSVETARFTPDTLWHNSSLGNIYASYPLIINAANTLDGVEYIKPNKIEFADGSGISEGILHYRDDELDLQSVPIKDIVNSSGGGFVPGYIKPNKIEFNDVSSGDQLISLTAATNQQSYIMPTAMRVRLNKNTDIYTDTSTQMYNSFTIYAGGINKYTTIRDKEIQTNDGTGAAKTLNLPNIADSQSSYLKPDKIEFADGSGLSADGLSYKEGSTTITKTIKEVLDAVDNSGGGTTYGYLTNEGIRTTGTQSITHKINSDDTLNRYSLTSNSINHQSRVTVGNSSGRRTEIQPDRIYLYEESGEFSGFYNSHIRYLKGGEVKTLNYDDVNETIDKVNKGYIKTSFWHFRDSSKTFWIGKYEKALEATYNFPSNNIIQFTEHAVRNSGKLLFRMWYNEATYSAGEIIKFIFRVQKPEVSSLANKYAMITADICDVPRNTYASQYLGALVEVVSVGPSQLVEDVEDNPGISFENEYYAYYTLQLRALKSIAVGELDFTMMFQFHGYLGDFGTMPTSMYVV